MILTDWIQEFGKVGAIVLYAIIGLVILWVIIIFIINIIITLIKDR